MQQKEDQQWDHNPQQSQSQTVTEKEDREKEKLRHDQIISDRVEEFVEDDITSLRMKNNQTPLEFRLKVGEGYLLSYKGNQVSAFVGKFIVLAVFMIGVLLFVLKVAPLPQQWRIGLVCIICLQLLTFMLLFFLDPGTLFEDEQEQINGERLYCHICRVYRSHSSHHCVFCVKCVRGFDHHCGVFSKCIGSRNLWLFRLFLASTMLSGLGFTGSLFFTIFQEALKKMAAPS